MGYSTATPPACVVQGLQNRQPATWKHSNADAVATVQVSGYITNAGLLGMKVGDLVEHYDTNLGITSTLNVTSISTTYPYAADLQDPTTIGSTTNTN